MRLIWFNLANDIDDPALGFALRWIEAMAKRVEFIHVIVIQMRCYPLLKSVRGYLLNKKKFVVSQYGCWDWTERMDLMILYKTVQCLKSLCELCAIVSHPNIKLS